MISQILLTTQATDWHLTAKWETEKLDIPDPNLYHLDLGCFFSELENFKTPICKTMGIF